MAKALEIKQIKSESKLKPKQMATWKALGLRGVGTTVYRSDLRAIRGMLNHLHHIVEARLIDGKVDAKKTEKKQKNRGIKVL